jgi:hypothetical protein
MSRTRAFISRLSFVLRAFLYLALIGAVGYIGFGFTSGYVAIPGDTLLRLNPHQREIVMFRSADCAVDRATMGAREDAAAKPKTPGTQVAPTAAPPPLAQPTDCLEPPILGLRNLALGPAGRVGVLVADDGTSVQFRSGAAGKVHLTIRHGDEVSEHQFTGKTIPEAVLAKIPASLRAQLQRMVEGSDVPEFATRGAPGGVFNVRVPPPGGPRARNQIGVLRDDDGTIVEFRHDSATGEEAQLTVRRGEKANTYAIKGKAIPEAAMADIPPDLRDAVRAMVEGRDLPPPATFTMPAPPPGAFTIPVPPPGAIFNGPYVQGGAVEKDIIFFESGGPQSGPFAASGALPFDGVIELAGPAIVQQQVLGHTGLRAGLVGITIALVFLAIIQLERLLAHFQRAELFSARNSGLLRNLGGLLILVALVQAGGTMLPAILARTLHPALIGALGPHLILVFAGSSLLLLAAVMAEAGRLEEEAQHTV